MSTSYFTTVREAIDHGKLNLFTIPRAFMYTGAGFSALFFFKKIWLPALDGQHTPIFGLSIAKFMAIGLAGIVAGFAWRNFHSAAWKVSLENVGDVHRLFQLAEQKGMIGKRGSWLNAIELATAEQKTRLAELETRLDGPRQMEGPSIPGGATDERAFNYSLKMLGLQLAMFVPFFGFLYYMDRQVSFFPFGLFAIILFGYTAFRWLPRFGQPAPIRLDGAGILLAKQNLVPWADVADILLESRKHGKSTVTFLVVATSSEQPKPIEIELTDIGGSDDEIEQAANDFWARWRAGQK